VKIPGRLEERLRNRRVVPFVGAGVAMAARRRDGRGEWADVLREQVDIPGSEVDEDSRALARAVWKLGSQGYAGRHYALVRPQDAARVQSLDVVPVDFADFGAPLVELVEELGRRAAAGPLPQAAAPEADAREADWSRYLDVLNDQTDHIEIRGISSSSSVHGARHPIEQLYTPLTSRGMPPRAMAPSEDGLEALGGGPIELADLLPRHRRLLIEGQPGAGKTTFLRLVACVLARDAAGRPCPGGGSWREAHLGLPSDAPPTPIFLRLADLVPLLAEDSALRHDDERWLLDLLERLSATNDVLVRGDGLLLLSERAAGRRDPAAAGEAVGGGGDAGEGFVSLGPGRGRREPGQLRPFVRQV